MFDWDAVPHNGMPYVQIGFFLFPEVKFTVGVLMLVAMMLAFD